MSGKSMSPLKTAISELYKQVCGGTVDYVVLQKTNGWITPLLAQHADKNIERLFLENIKLTPQKLKELKQKRSAPNAEAFDYIVAMSLLQALAEGIDTSVALAKQLHTLLEESYYNPRNLNPAKITALAALACKACSGQVAQRAPHLKTLFSGLHQTLDISRLKKREAMLRVVVGGVLFAGFLAAGIMGLAAGGNPAVEHLIATIGGAIGLLICACVIAKLARDKRVTPTEQKIQEAEALVFGNPKHAESRRLILDGAPGEDAFA